MLSSFSNARRAEQVGVSLRKAVCCPEGGVPHIRESGCAMDVGAMDVRWMCGGYACARTCADVAMSVRCTCAWVSYGYRTDMRISHGYRTGIPTLVVQHACTTRRHSAGAGDNLAHSQLFQQRGHYPLSESQPHVRVGIVRISYGYADIARISHGHTNVGSTARMHNTQAFCGGGR